MIGMGTFYAEGVTRSYPWSGSSFAATPSIVVASCGQSSLQP